MTMIEIVLGGIGYPLIFDVYEKIRLKRKNIHYRFSLFSKVCAVSYVLVFAIGLSISFGFEFGAPNTGNMLSDNATLMSINNIPGCKYWGDNELFNKC
jgi:Trk-type K+ transport system membrane component